MRRTNKPKIGLLDIGRLPLTPAKTIPGVLSKRDERALVNAEIAADLAADRKKAWLQTPEGQLATLQAQATGELAEFAAEFEPKLKACWLGSPTRDKAIPDSVILGGYETREVSITDNLTDFQTELNASYDQFTAELDRRGIEFKSSDAVAKLVGFMITTFVKAGIAYTSGNWMRAFERLFQLGVLDSTMVTGYTALVYTAPQAPAKTQQQIDAERFDQISTLTREGDAESRALASKGWAVEVQRMYLDWARNNMEAIWGVPFDKMISPEVIDCVGEFFQRMNISPFRADSYDRARRFCDANGVLGTVPGSLLLASEKLALSIENSDLNDREVRQNINRRLLEISQAANPRLR